MSGFGSTRFVRFSPERSHAAGGQDGPDHRSDWASSEEAVEGGGGETLGAHGYSKDHRPDLIQIIWCGDRCCGPARIRSRHGAPPATTGPPSPASRPSVVR